MRTEVLCSWCHTANTVQAGTWPFCATCGHRADKPRIDCDCDQCQLALVKAYKQLDAGDSSGFKADQQLDLPF